jgi:hypothetical protein
MKPITNNEFEAREEQAFRVHPDLLAWAGKYLNTLKQLCQPRYDFDLLAPRLRRDAGIDELEIERRKVAKAPLIR